MSVKIAGPIMLPDTPDCDYPDGEELLSPIKIQQLLNSFKEYNIIDYDHQFTDPDMQYFLSNIGVPTKVFTTTKEITFTDVSDTQITVPSGTAWLECTVTNPSVKQMILNKEIVAFSITVAEKEDADYFKQLYSSVNDVGANKSNKHSEIKKVHERITQKRTLIKDIKDPAMLTVSVVRYPCVYKAKFCKQSVIDLNIPVNEVDKMTDDYETTFIENIKADLQKLRNSIKNEEEQTEDTVNDDFESFKAEVLKSIDEFKEEIKELLSSLKEDNDVNVDEEETVTEEEVVAEKQEETETITESDTDEEEEEETTAEEETEEEEEVVEKQEETIPTEETTTEETMKTKSATVTTNKGETDEKSSVGKAFSKKAEEHKIKQKTAQPTRKTTLKHEGGVKSMKTIHERDLIQNAIKGDGTAIKTAVKENNKIIYDTREYNLVPYYQHKGVLATLNKAGKHVFQESFSEEETNKAILSTELFAQYVRELLTPENIFDYANYQTVYGEEAAIRRVKAASSYTSQDGHLPANYYFDNTPDAAELKHEKDVIRPVTQRDLFSISDRQLRNNVFGDDLLDVSLATVKETFYNGVYAARILGDTSKEDATYTDANNETQTVDTQFTRKDGWLAQAGVQLDSENDFDVNKIVDVFDTMYYSLPEYAQEESDYVFFVPSQVRRAYYNYFVRNARESKLDLVSSQQPLYYNNIPILTSKTLNNAEFRNMLTDGDAKIFLTKPENTLLGVGRGFGIEPERRADISATYYYLTLDTDAKFARPEEAVTATIKADDYATLPVTTAEIEP